MPAFRYGDRAIQRRYNPQGQATGCSGPGTTVIYGKKSSARGNLDRTLVVRSVDQEPYYYGQRAEVGLGLARLSSDPVAKAHCHLAGYYLDRVQNAPGVQAKPDDMRGEKRL